MGDMSNDEGHDRFDVDSTPQHDMPIAICGIALRLPGGVRSDADLLDLLRDKRDTSTVVPSDRFNIESYYDPSGKPGSIITNKAHFIDVDLDQFDSTMFGMSKAEVRQMDPAQRLLLEVTREALESGGEGDFRGKPIGTFVGSFTQDWDDLHNIDTLRLAPYQVPGKADFMHANRLAFEYNLTGPSLPMKTACSATAQAVNHAVLSIQAGSCPSAIVAGANLIMAPRPSIEMTMLGVLAPDGSCKTFDAGANGYARGESVCAIFIKRLDLAIRDGNPIRAIIRACDANADGGDGTRTWGTPNPAAQEALIRQTYARAKIPLSQTGVVECHGTGTPTGDPLELTAIANCFGRSVNDDEDRKVYVGSIKPNLGHAEGGSIMSSIAKAVLALENRIVLPNIKFSIPNPKCPWNQGLTVPVEPMAWPTGFTERMSINSFGLGGANVHLVIDSAASFGLPRLVRRPADPPSGKALLLLSGNSAASIMKMAEKYQEYLTKYPSRRNAVCHTLAARRERLQLTSYSIANGVSLSTPSTPVARTSAYGVAFIFTGQGAQWLGMGRELIYEQPVFAQSIRQMDAVLQKLPYAPEWTLESILTAGTVAKGNLDDTDLSQPVCAALQIALVDLLAAWGVEPVAVVGHSSGEVAAAYAAGILSQRQAIITAFYRGYACARNELKGSMAAVGLGRDVVEPHLAPGCVLACENSDSSVTISGDIEALDQSQAAIQAAYPQAFVRRLRVPMAYHSPHMGSIAPLYAELLGGHLTPRTPRLPYYSTVYGRRIDDGGLFGPEYWQLNMESPVLFRTAVSAMIAERGPRVVHHLEIGPHSALAGPLRQISSGGPMMRSTPSTYVPVLVRNEDAAQTMLAAVGQLSCLGINTRIPTSTTTRIEVLHDLPTYPWTYTESFDSLTRVQTLWRFAPYRKHELLGRRVLESSDLEPAWRNYIKLNEVSWLPDHVVGRDIVFPAAGYLAIAGVAVSQLAGTASHDYTVRQVHFAAALLLHDTTACELVTTLRKRSLTTILDSKWYDFTIVSVNKDGTATKHCFGQVTGGCSTALPSARTQSYAKRVDVRRWYTTMNRIGLNYGPRFVGMKDITASPSTQAAALTITDHCEPGEPYALHPTTLDLMLQSWGVAAVKGEARRMDQLSLPTSIDELFVGQHGAGKMLRVQSSAEGPVEAAVGYAHGMVDDRVVFALKGFKTTRIADTTAAKRPDLKALTLQWHPDADFAPLEQYMRPARDATSENQLLERLYILCAAQASAVSPAIHSSTLVPTHLQKYRSWLEEEVQRFTHSEIPLVPDSACMVAMSSQDRQAAIEQLVRDAAGPVRPAVDALWRTFSRLDDLVTGSTGLLEVLLAGGLLSEFYDYCSGLSDLKDLYALLGTNKPQMRVLEIGAGCGGTTLSALAGLRSNGDVRLYQSYTATDISPAFLAQCRERFQHYGNITYATLDISRDPLQQGFERGAFDLIIASNTLHATPNLVQTLQHCRELLASDGHMLLQEWSSPGRWYDFIMGLFDGWWLGADDGRQSRAVVCPDEWDKRLRIAGFTGLEACAFDNSLPYYNCANMVTRPRVDLQGKKAAVTLLTATKQLSPFEATTKSLLENAGFATSDCSWAERLPESQDIISFLDVNADNNPFLADISDKDLSRFIDMIKNPNSGAIVWLTDPAQSKCSSAQYGQILGVARTVRAECGKIFASMQLETADELAAQAVSDVFHKIRLSRELGLDESDVDIDAEYLWRDNRILLSRFHPFSVEQALAGSAPPTDALALSIGRRGQLQSLQWNPIRFDELGADEVRIKMNAAGLNFLDVVYAMNLIDIDSVVGNALGKEGAGVVTAVGSGVKDFTIGDRVTTMSVDAPIFATEIQRPSSLVVRTPDGLSDEDAAGMFIVYATVILALIEKAQLVKSQSVLIHSAAGGVGIAAVHVARWLDLEIYCTVGSEAKIKFLSETMGIPRERIFASRDDSFLEGIMEATNGRGVDAVLNSLSGELLHATWSCVAPGGCMLEIGKRDFRGRGQLALQPFEMNRAYFGVDLLSLPSIDPKAAPRLFNQVAKLYREGHIHPIRPSTIFAAEKAEDAFRYMQKGDHIGRVILRFPKDKAELPTKAIVPKPTFKPDREYMLIGGLGGLGQSVISWMAAHGARHFMVISRSAGTKVSDQAFIQEMVEVGCSLRCFPGSAADLSFLQHVVSQAAYPVAGVIQAAMVLRDLGLTNMDHDSWTTALTPKVQGTWNLQQALPSDLDFFVMFGSNSGTLASYGQANYAAANAYLDAFVHFRHTLGLPASVLDIAAVGDVGYVANNKDVAERMERTIGRFMSEEEFLIGVQLAIERSSSKYIKPHAARVASPIVAYHEQSQIILHNDMSIPLSNAENTMPWRRDARMTIYRNSEEVQQQRQEQQSSEGLRSFIASLAVDPELLEDSDTAAFFAREIFKRVLAFLMKDADVLDLSLTLTSVGADSLVAIEIRNWWKQAFGTDVSVLELSDAGMTMEQLGMLAVQRLKEKMGVE
ncbi:polyketide synthase like protein [Zymoseptoria brevis]|uniref:Polyketide synthase like protein n=1 Tax=Zymoseptoria brevis TaxID=1047168 RepID=A0A0F4GAC0_9PEZI|nr:polyketide synthase like protein [Zymoseptoria brevis]